MHVWVPGCIYVPHVHAKVLEIRKGIGSSKTGVTDSCELRVGAGNKNPDLVQDQ